MCEVSASVQKSDDSGEVIKLVPLNEIIKMRFNIPKYQRGYRWGREQVEALLADLSEFYLKKDKGAKEIYCLQPLVVKANNEESKEWNVVDGQQRLTTLYILISWLTKECSSGEEIDNCIFTVEYESRIENSDYDSKSFINNLFYDEAISNKIDSCPDFYYMYKARTTIEAWSGWDGIDKNEYFTELLERVHFIWYDIKDEDEIEVFKRLNIGRISLTESELVKAIFLNDNNFTLSVKTPEDCDSYALIQEEKERIQRITEIANEWDQIEYQLQDDRFWLFIHEVEYDRPTRIDFILDLVRVFDKEYLKNNGAGFSRMPAFDYFYNKYKDYKASDESDLYEFVDTYWSEIRNVFNTLCEWYSDDELYHYIGYLCTVNHNGKNSVDLISDYLSWYRDGDKKDFINKLKKEIKNCIKNALDLGQLYEADKRSKRETYPLLLLHNVLTVIDQNDCVKKEKKYELPYFERFPFHLFNKEHWDIEHIRPDHSEAFLGPRKKNSRRKYWYIVKENFKNQLGSNKDLELALDYYNDLFLISISKDNPSDFEKLCDDVCRNKEYEKFISKDLRTGYLEDYCTTKDVEALFDLVNKSEEDAFEKLWSFANEEKENELNANQRNYVWNYVLLDSSTNREYGNSCYSIKRDFIIKKSNGIKPHLDVITKDKDKKGKVEVDYLPESAFIPCCTMKVFDKSYTDYPDNLQYWTQKDAVCYRMDIEKRLWWYISEKMKKQDGIKEDWNSLIKDVAEDKLHKIYDVLWTYYHEKTVQKTNHKPDDSMIRFYEDDANRNEAKNRLESLGLLSASMVDKE